MLELQESLCGCRHVGGKRSEVGLNGNTITHGQFVSHLACSGLEPRSADFGGLRPNSQPFGAGCKNPKRTL